MEQLLHAIKVAYSGAGTTLAITSVAVVLGVILGLVVSLCKTSKIKPLRAIAIVYVEILRGTPLVVQALLFYFGIPMLVQSFGIDFVWPSAVFVGMLVCGINSSAYIAEIIRAGLQAIDKGQTEAARSLGMSQAQTMRHVIIPQAFKVIIPPLGNEFITLIKETAILSMISVTDITRASMLYASSSFVYFQAYFGTAIVYLSLTIPLSRIMNLIEKRLANDVKS